MMGKVNVDEKNCDKFIPRNFIPVNKENVIIHDLINNNRETLERE